MIASSEAVARIKSRGRQVSPQMGWRQSGPIQNMGPFGGMMGAATGMNKLFDGGQMRGGGLGPSMGAMGGMMGQMMGNRQRNRMQQGQGKFQNLMQQYQAGRAAGQNMDWMKQPGALSPQYGGQIGQTPLPQPPQPIGNAPMQNTGISGMMGPSAGMMRQRFGNLQRGM